MIDVLQSFELAAAAQVAGSVCQMATAVIAAGIAGLTFRYTRRQSSLSLINQTNQLANLVNTTLIQSAEARAAMGKLQDVIVGSPDDAMLFMYLNYVHNTYRTFRIGAVGRQVWADTLESCARMLSRLERWQVEKLLARGYEAEFHAAVVSSYAALRADAEGLGNVALLFGRQAA